MAKFPPTCFALAPASAPARGLHVSSLFIPSSVPPQVEPSDENEEYKYNTDGDNDKEVLNDYGMANDMDDL